MSNPPQQPSNLVSAVSTASTQSCTVEMVPRHLKMHTVSESELDSISSGGPAINLTFFGLCVGTLVSFGTVLKTATTLDAATKAVFIALFFTSAVMATFFGVRGIRDFLANKKKLEEIKRGPILK
jgi:hypothetical protein